MPETENPQLDPQSHTTSPSSAAERCLEEETRQAMRTWASQEEDEGEGSGEADFEMPDEIPSEGHLALASRHAEDDPAYALLPDIAWLRQERIDNDLRIEGSLVLSKLKM